MVDYLENILQNEKKTIILKYWGSYGPNTYTQRRIPDPYCERTLQIVREDLRDPEAHTAISESILTK